jgi:hypothetical protein
MMDEDKLPPREAEHRREAALKRMLNTPPQPHKKKPGQRESQKDEKPISPATPEDGEA